MSEKQKEPGKKDAISAGDERQHGGVDLLGQGSTSLEREGSVRCCIWRLFAVCGGQVGVPVGSFQSPGACG